MLVVGKIQVGESGINGGHHTLLFFDRCMVGSFAFLNSKCSFMVLHAAVVNLNRVSVKYFM